LVQVNETGLGEIGAPEAAKNDGAQLDPKDDSMVVYKGIRRESCYCLVDPSGLIWQLGVNFAKDYE
jgi:hypothetical protein